MAYNTPPTCTHMCSQTHTHTHNHIYTALQRNKKVMHAAPDVKLEYIYTHTTIIDGCIPLPASVDDGFLPQLAGILSLLFQINMLVKGVFV